MPQQIVGKVAQADSGADARQPYILQFRAAHAVFYAAEYMFDPTPNLGLQPVELLLQFVQRPVPHAFFVHVVCDAELRKRSVDLRAFVRTVREQLLVLVFRADQFRQRLRVVHRGVGHGVVGDDRRVGIGPDVIFIAVKCLVIFLRPPRIQIFLAQLVRLVFPLRRGPALLDHFVFLPRVALPGHLDETRVHDRARFGDDTLLCQDGTVSVEQRLDHPGSRQGLAKEPHRGKNPGPRCPTAIRENAETTAGR